MVTFKEKLHWAPKPLCRFNDETRVLSYWRGKAKEEGRQNTNEEGEGRQLGNKKRVSREDLGESLIELEFSLTKLYHVKNYKR